VRLTNREKKKYGVWVHQENLLRKELKKYHDDLLFRWRRVAQDFDAEWYSSLCHHKFSPRVVCV